MRQFPPPDTSCPAYKWHEPLQARTVGRSAGTTAAACLMLWSCSSESQKSYKTFSDVEEEFAATLSANDTTEVLTAGTALLDSLKAGKIDVAVNMLNTTDAEGNIVPLSDEKRAQLVTRFERFPVVDYELEYYNFSLPALNDLKYRTFFSEKDASGNAPALSLMLNPVKKDGKWYLCLKEAGQPAKDAANAVNPDLIIAQ